MTVPWMRREGPLDFELAVALELAALQLNRARTPCQLDQAITYNLRLWRTVREVAERHPALAEREELADTADHVATMLVADAGPCPDPRDLAFIAGRNLALARDLAGQSGIEGLMQMMLDDWGRSGRQGGSFEGWVLHHLTQRLDGDLVH